jgi:hypothetical protein
MRTAIHLVEEPFTEIQPHSQRDQEPISFGDDIYGLQAEVSALREELARAERTIRQKDVLLRNGMVREMALRMELGSSLR